MLNLSFLLIDYDVQVMKMLERCELRDMPPHIYSVARSAYECLRKTAQSQSIVLLGYSGGGKTTNVCHILEYFCLTTAMQPCRQKLCKFLFITCCCSF